MKKTNLLSDLLYMLKLWAPKKSTLFIFDPFERLIIDTDLPLDNLDEYSPKILVSYADEITCYKDMYLEEFDLILDFGESKMPSVFEHEKINYIHNPDKSMRWLYPHKNKTASFLSFYNASTFKSKFISGSIKMAFKLGCKSLVKSGSFHIYSKKEMELKRIMKGINYSAYSIFMGSPGVNRTALVELNTEGKSTHFIKFPLNVHSKLAIQNEMRYLGGNQSSKWDKIVIPKLIPSGTKNVLITKNIQPEEFKRSNELTNVHFDALKEMASKSIKLYHFKSSTFWSDVKIMLHQLEGRKDKNQLYHYLVQLKTDLEETKKVYTSMAHGDFTPWNMFVGKQKLFVYDWEMGESEVPLLYDFFHFHFQTGVLVKRISFEEIKKNILKACETSQISYLIDNYKIDIETYFKMYLLKMISTNMLSFQNEIKWSTQHHWLFNTYKVALKESFMISSKEILRNVFIRQFNNRMRKTTHAYLKLSEGSLEGIKSSSDIDVLILKGDENKIVQFCKNHIDVERIKYHRKSFMTIVELFFRDGSFLCIDLIYQFKRKGIQFLDARSVLISSIANEYNYLVPNIKFDFEYSFLFYTLNGANIPEKYWKSYNEENEFQKNQIFKYINRKYNLNLLKMEQLYTNSEIYKRKIIEKIESRNSVGFSLKNKLNYFKDTIKDIFFRKGMVITFSGVDGAGKSTIIERVKERLQNKYRKEVVLLRHRPGILPILSAIKHGQEKAEQIASVTLPRKGKNNNLLSSFLRFTYYFTDYVIGQVYIYFKYILRGKIVLYDRYYFDFINDAKRSNIQLNRSFVKALYRFIFKPKLNFFLYADAETILARKQELVAPEIDHLTGLYKQLFGQMSERYKDSHYKIIENKELDSTLNKIMNSYAKLA
jgi:thymidylate kinase